MFSDMFTGKKVLITGNTGFKGSWLTVWLLKLGARVYGISKDIPSQPSMFEELGLAKRITHYHHDIRDVETVCRLVAEIMPDFVFHLAAQPIVSLSYKDPIETLSSNVMGTAHVLEALRRSSHPCCAVIITSDKCYDNVEWVWGYRETDGLGGKDIYSGSKGAAELVIKSYFHSFFARSGIKVASARAGNVIGGGDWATDRIIPDCMRAWSAGQPVTIRNPHATRPWQHVLEPLSGYMLLASKMWNEPTMYCEGWNFGPYADSVANVWDVSSMVVRNFGIGELVDISFNSQVHEAKLLMLEISKAAYNLKWAPKLSLEKTVKFTSDWYKAYKSNDMYIFSVNQILEYCKN